MVVNSHTGFVDENKLNQGRRFFSRLHIDLPLLIALLALTSIGLSVLYSASGQNMNVINAQLIRLVLAFSVMFAVAQISPHTIKAWSPWLFMLGLLLLILVLTSLGDVGKGAQRWLVIGFRFQPSEIMKLAVPMMVAWYFADMPLPPARSKIFIASIILVIPTLLVAKQPDLGTALLIACSGFFVLILAGLRWRTIFTTIFIIAASTPFIWNYALHEYQQKRVLTFLNPESDKLGSGYHIIQSIIAIGSGGVYGKGWNNGTQSRLEFIPERKTDFIFSVYSEEFGFIGILLLLSLYLFIIIRGCFIATQAQDTFSRLLAGGLIMTFFVYVYVNMGMVSGLLPVVGVPLPLVSYGGTSIVTLFAAFGILMSIHTHKKFMTS